MIKRQRVNQNKWNGKSKLQVPDTGTRVLDNTKPFWRSSIICFWMPPARSKERKYHISGQYWYTRNVPVFTNTGTFQYLGPEVYFFQWNTTWVTSDNHDNCYLLHVLTDQVYVALLYCINLFKKSSVCNFFFFFFFFCAWQALKFTLCYTYFCPHLPPISIHIWYQKKKNPYNFAQIGYFLW